MKFDADADSFRGYEKTKTSCWPRRFRANSFGFVAAQTLIFNGSREF